MILLAIDPGTCTGWARFCEGKLTLCGHTNPANWHLLVSTFDGADVIIEEPTIYPHSKANPASVMKLQLKAGELKGRFEAAGCSVQLVQPRTWKRQVPKVFHHPRILKVLSDEERRLAEGRRGDVLDAIGLGLWKLGRMK